MEIGKPYTLKEFPDSIFIDTLDRFFEKEWVRPERLKAEITITPNLKHTLPKQTNAAKESPKAKEKSTQSQNFTEIFMESLTKLSENPNGKAGSMIKAKKGESLESLLIRTYGQRVKQVPRFLTESQIKALNPSVNFEYLSEGEQVLLPLIK